MFETSAEEKLLKIEDHTEKQSSRHRCFISRYFAILQILGKRLDYEDAAHRAIMEYNREMVKVVSVSVGSMIMRFPFLRHIPLGYGKLYQRGMAALDKLVHYMYEEPKVSTTK